MHISFVEVGCSLGQYRVRGELNLKTLGPISEHWDRRTQLIDVRSCEVHGGVRRIKQLGNAANLVGSRAMVGRLTVIGEALLEVFEALSRFECMREISVNFSQLPDFLQYLEDNDIGDATTKTMRSIVMDEGDALQLELAAVLSLQRVERGSRQRVREG